MTRIAEFAAELTTIEVGGDAIALWRVADLERHVERDGEEVRPRAAPRDDLLARLLEGLLLADVLVAMEDRLHERLVDARLDVEDRKAHGAEL